MAAGYLHNRKDFPGLLRIIEGETNIFAGLIEKDYWIMHVLYGLKQMGYDQFVDEVYEHQVHLHIPKNPKFYQLIHVKHRLFR